MLSSSGSSQSLLSNKNWGWNGGGGEIKNAVGFMFLSVDSINEQSGSLDFSKMANNIMK